jgi:hypothetical protein
MIYYTLRAGTRHAQKTGRAYNVEEIYVDGQLVGAMHASDNTRFGEVTDPDGTTYPHGDCIADTMSAWDTMVGMIMRHRAVGNWPDWRSEAARRKIEREPAERIG